MRDLTDIDLNGLLMSTNDGSVSSFSCCTVIHINTKLKCMHRYSKYDTSGKFKGREVLSGASMLLA